MLKRKMQIKSILIVAFNIMYNVTTSFSLNNKEKQIDELEKLKGDLFNQINNAINDSLKILEKNADASSVFAVDNMKELRKQISELNATSDSYKEITKDKYKDVKEILDDFGSDVETRKRSNDSDVRRSNKGFIASDRNLHLKLNLQEIADMLKGTPKPKTKTKNITEVKKNNLLIEKKLMEWIIERKREKVGKRNKGKEIFLRYKYERCPRFGIKKKSKSIGLKFNSGKKEIKSRKEPKYPCCRKCCKKSYLGCL